MNIHPGKRDINRLRDFCSYFLVLIKLQEIKLKISNGAEMSISNFSLCKYSLYVRVNNHLEDAIAVVL